MTRNRLRNGRAGRKRKKRAHGFDQAGFGRSSFSALLDELGKMSPSDDLERMPPETVQKIQRAAGLPADADLRRPENYERWAQEFERYTARHGGPLDEPLVVEFPSPDGGPPTSSVIFPTPASPFHGKNARDYSPERAAVITRVEGVLAAERFPLAADELAAIFRTWHAGVIFDVFMSLQTVTSPLIAALVDLWNYTPLDALGGWAPVEALRVRAEEPERFLRGSNDGRWMFILESRFALAVHNGDEVDALGLPPDPELTAEQLAEAFHDLQGMASAGKG